MKFTPPLYWLCGAIYGSFGMFSLDIRSSHPMLAACGGAITLFFMLMPILVDVRSIRRGRN